MKIANFKSMLIRDDSLCSAEEACRLSNDGAGIVRCVKHALTVPLLEVVMDLKHKNPKLNWTKK